MKKILSLISATLATLVLIAVPATVHAQAEEDPIEIGGEETTDITALPETGATAGVPETGLDPNGNKVVQNIVVFTGGGLLGAGIGYGIIRVRKNSLK